MQAASRAYVLAAAALAATSAVVVTMPGSRPHQLPVRSYETRLVDSDSVLNIPVNLFDDILNIPYNEVQGLDVLDNSLFFSGDWWVPSATNLWGTDPGDLGHYMGLLDILIPFPQISGLDQPEIDPTADADGTAGLAQQIGLLAAAELPTSASCDAETCYPMTPPNVITGSTDFDRDIGLFQALSGQATTQDGSPFGLFSNWFQVPLSELTSGNFTFNSTTDPGGIVDPSPDTGPDGAVTGADGFDGTTGADGTTAGDMPWDGDTFKLNLFGPFEDFYNSLLATPSTSGVDGTGIEIPTSTSILEAFQNLEASSIVAFDPYVEGSPACPATCDLPADETQLALLNDVLAMNPSDTELANYINDFPDSNGTTTEAELSVALLQTGIYNLTPTELATYDADLAAINPELPYLYTNAGIVTDPNYVAFGDGTTSTFDPTYGGYDPNLVASDLLTLLTNNDTNYTALSNIDTLWFLADPVSASAAASNGTASATDLSTALNSVDPTLSTDFSTLMASFGTTAGSDLLSQLVTDLTTQITADLSTVLPSSILTMF
jgi:hypothetical protein